MFDNEYYNQLHPYLCSICRKYAQWWKIYTLTDVVGKQRDEEKQFSPLLDLGLMVQTVKQQQEKREEAQEKVERLAVIEGLRKYAPEHVLLVGRPGSGKSTALVRLLLEEAERGRDAETRRWGDGEMGRWGDGDFYRIPVLVELRFYQHSVLERVKAFLLQHDPDLDVDEEILKKWLRQGKLLLLLDGFNELPSDEARQQVRVFRKDYPKTPMVFTTRHLQVGGDLNISKKLEMQPLTETQMRQFVCAYLPQQGEQMLKQLGSRLREFGETPLLLWMLCSVFASNSYQIPANLGSVFRRFIGIHDNELKQDVVISEEFRLWQRQSLQHLAWVMVQGEGETQFYVSLPQHKAAQVLKFFLQGEGVLKNDPLLWLENLLKHHLIESGTGEQIGFCHQLILEYYAAESLLLQLASLSDQQLKWDYLNYLKWTEPVALMMQLLEDRDQAVRVVKLALEMDWLLGARLAGEVKSEFQEETVGLVVGLPLPRLLKVKLAGVTKSDEAIPELINALEESNSEVRKKAVESLGEIGLNTAVTALINVLEDSDFEVRMSAADALGKIGSNTAITALINVLEDSDFEVRMTAADALGKIGSNTAITALINVLEDSDFEVRMTAADALGKIGSDTAVNALINTLKDSDFEVRMSAADALGKIGSDIAVNALIQDLEYFDCDVGSSALYSLSEIGSDTAVTSLINALEQSDFEARMSAAYALSEIGSDAAVTALINALEHSNFEVRASAADALGKVGSDTAVTLLIQALEHSDFEVRSSAVYALGEIGSDTAVTLLIQALENSESEVRWSAVYALGEIGSDAAVTSLIKTLEDSNYKVRCSAVYALAKIGSDTAVTALINALKHSEYDVRKLAADALGEIDSDTAVSTLINTLEYSESDVRSSVADALVEIGSDDDVTTLIQAIEDSNFEVRSTAVDALGKIRSDAAIPALINALEDPDSDVRSHATEALVKFGSDSAIPPLNKKLQDHNSAIANDKYTLNKSLTALRTIQERCQYYRPTPKLTMSNPLSHNYALLIGVGESAYPEWSLPVTVKDTLALKSLLTDTNLCGYSDDEQHLRLLNNAIATKESILSNLNWLQQQAAADSEATVLVYYSGHGWLNDKTGKYYLIPHDIIPHKIPNSALAADTFQEALRQIPAKRLLVIIDSCHAAGMASAKNEQGDWDLPDDFIPTALPKDLINQLQQGTGRVVLTSSTGKQKSWVRPDGKMSIYTFHLLEVLQGAGNQPGDQVVTISNLMNYLGKTVPASAKQLCQQEQTPFFDFATEDFPVALLHGGKGLPQQGWDGLKVEAQERISQIGNVNGNNNKVNIGDRTTKISIGTAGDIKIGDISS
ncbi:MAG: NACHT domain-containing protein [Symploca sp. SIO2E6]|nr:NACHT domain-containing protein [Symploca sp. SIO2E6]